MNTIRNKLKHGFGHNKNKSVHSRQTTAQQSVSAAASGSKPEKSIVDDSRVSNRRSRKTTVKTAKHSVDPSAAGSSATKSPEGSVMDRKKKSTIKPRKTKSFKATKPCPTPTNKEFLNTENTAGPNLRRASRVCDSAHEGRLVLHSKLEIPIEQLFKLIFSPSANCSWHSLYSKFNSFRDSYSNDIKFTVNENTFEIDSYIFIYIYQQFLKWN